MSNQENPFLAIAAPQVAGSTEQAIIMGLEAGAHYFAAIKTVDERGNWSPLSNVIAIGTRDDIPPGRIDPLNAHTGINEGAIDLDWLLWFDADVDDTKRDQVFLANLAAIVDNYIDAGVERFLMAGAIRDEATLAAVREAVPVLLRVVRLTVPLPEIEARLGTAVTAGREDDLRVAAEWVAASTGVGVTSMPSSVPQSPSVRITSCATSTRRRVR